jgi:hypothetical protein
MSYTPQQNGVVERKNRILLEMARYMVKGKHLLDKFCLEALRVIRPYEAWNGRKPMLSQMRIFGCLAYTLVPSQ